MRKALPLMIAGCLSAGGFVELAQGADLLTVYRDAVAYDAQYASLAKQLGIRCVTEDGPVQEACQTIAISLDDFLKGPQAGGMVRELQAAYRTRRKR